MNSTTVYLQQAVLVAIQTVALRRRRTYTISSKLRQLRTDTRLQKKQRRIKWLQVAAWCD